MTELHTSSEQEFYQSVENLRGTYATQALDETISNCDLLISLYEHWADALDIVATYHGIATEKSASIPHALEKRSIMSLGEDNNFSAKTILGIAGPGAAGKETLAKALGYPKVINTTTRPRRDYEVDGIHYRFLDEQQFKGVEDSEGFVSVTNRPGRGLYGIQKQDLDAVFSNSEVAIIEENPATLSTIGEGMQVVMPDARFLLSYILPPDPIPVHLATRLAQRCLVAGEDYRTAIESTLGQRQIDEFLSVISAQEKGTKAFYLVNDKVERATEVIRSVVSSHEIKEEDSF